MYNKYFKNQNHISKLTRYHVTEVHTIDLGTIKT